MALSIEADRARVAAAAAAAAAALIFENPLARTGPQLSRVGSKGAAPEHDCHCGAISLATIQRILLDPRNHSIEYWRERRPEVLLSAQAQSPRSLVVRKQLLGIGYTPFNVHETARLRLGGRNVT